MIVNVTNKIPTEYLELICFDTVEPFSAGHYGEVFLLTFDDRRYAVKRFKPTMHEKMGTYCYDYDYRIMRELSESQHFPTLHAFKEREWLVTEYIDGISFRHEPDQESYRSQLIEAFQYSVSKGWFPIDVKGENVMVADGVLIIVDVGEFLPVIEDVEFDITKRVNFVMDHVNVFPSVKDPPPYELQEKEV